MKTLVNREYHKILKKYQSSDPVGLVKEAKCKILYADLDDETGGCTQSNNRCHTIIVNANWPEWYQKFVILHEFSHIRLHGGTSTPFYRTLGLTKFISEMECEANQLALMLLMNMQDEEFQNLTSFEKLCYLGLPGELERFI